MEIVAACHIHSVWSYDGSWSLEELRARFSRRGCRILMMTEHDRGFTTSRLDEYRAACAEASSERLLIVPGIEYSDATNRVHVLVWGRLPFLGEGLPTSRLLDAVKAGDGLAVLAHPSRKSAWQCVQSQWADQLLGIEVWNRKYDGWAPGEAARELLPTSTAIPFVGLDFHTERQLFPLAMAVELSTTVTEETVLDSLRARRCSPRAFGFPLDHHAVRTSLPVLGVAEQSRRLAASIVRHSKMGPR
jgi:hypothetical protein